MRCTSPTSWGDSMISPTVDQIRTIHKLKKAAGLEDTAYRDMLRDNWSVDSSKSLTPGQADELILGLRKLVGGPVAGAGRFKYENLGPRPGFANPAQLRMIEAMFADVSIHRDQASRDLALQKLLQHRFHIMGVLAIQRVDVQRVVRLLKAMRAQQQPKKEAA